jgi:voltage-dependent calcium channel N type alpha-1B
LINTLFLASDHYDPPLWLVKLSNIANLFFTIVFLIEMIMKITGFGCRKYLSDGFNIFDAFIVSMSYVELIIPGNSSSLSVLRTFRLLRIFKIIKSWQSLRILLSTVLDSLTAITNLGVLIILFLFISALLTKQFYSEPLLDMDGNESRYNFASTTSALVTVFIILTGENWNEIMV